MLLTHLLNTKKLQMNLHKRITLSIIYIVWIGFLFLSGWLLTLYSSIFFWSDNSQMSQSLVQSIVFPVYPVLSVAVYALNVFVRRLVLGSYRFLDPCVLGLVSIIVGIWIHRTHLLSPDAAAMTIFLLITVSALLSLWQAWRELRKPVV